MAPIPKWKLHVLKYPREEHFDISQPDEVVNFVAFLEDRHIRFLQIAERTPLRKPGAAWNDAFRDYMTELGCPLIDSPEGNGAAAGQAFAAERIPEYVSWLVSKAFTLSYEEKAADFNAGAAATLSAPRAGAGMEVDEGASAGPAGASAPVPPEAVALINQLAGLCHVDAAGRSPVQILQRVHRVIRQRVLPAVESAQAQAAAAEAGAGAGATAAEAGAGAGAGAGKAGAGAGARRSRPGSLPTREPTREDILAGVGFPLGLATGVPTLDAAARILRMLYVADLRELQDAVTDILVAVQEYTADPRTDASLGVVGR